MIHLLCWVYRCFIDSLSVSQQLTVFTILTLNIWRGATIPNQNFIGAGEVEVEFTLCMRGGIRCFPCGKPWGSLKPDGASKSSDQTAVMC